ncbi:class I SAM-dependent methyltransferase [Candidatus Woesearchaeota archaeon]|nr:class I SAM-dependent methyltransferase [Candidatus Woesearchaeota archaeon]
MDPALFSEKKFAEISEWEDNKFNLKKVYRLIGKYCPNGKGKRLLDVGCGDGSFALMIKNRYGFDAEGVDIAGKAVQRANRSGVKAKVCNIEKKLPYESGRFDAVILCEVIEHIFDTESLIKEIYRVMKKGGLLFLTTPNVASLTSRIRLLFGGYPNGVEYCVSPNSIGHIRAYTPKILKRQLMRNKFFIVKMTSPNFLFPVKSKSIPLAIREFMIDFSDITKNLGEQIVAVAKK